METIQFKVTYEIKKQTYTIEVPISGSLEREDIKLAARKIIRRKHPGVKYWEIKTVSIERIK